MIESIEKLRKYGLETDYGVWASEINELADAIQAEVEANYMPYLLDADGEPIRIGDSVDARKWHESGTVEGFTVNCRTHDGDLVWYDACDLAHAKPRTVDDVLVELLASCGKPTLSAYDERAIKKYAAELQMKGGE